MFIRGKFYFFDTDGNESPSAFQKRIEKELTLQDWENNVNIPSVCSLFETEDDEDDNRRFNNTRQNQLTTLSRKLEGNL